MDSPAVPAFETLGDNAEPSLAPRRNHQVKPFGGEHVGERLADAGGRAGNECCLSSHGLNHEGHEGVLHEAHEDVSATKDTKTTKTSSRSTAAGGGLRAAACYAGRVERPSWTSWRSLSWSSWLNVISIMRTS